jgi:hypothetical protein
VRWIGPNPSVQEVEEGQLAIGVMELPLPHVALVTRKGEDLRIHRFQPEDAREMGEQLVAFAEQLIREASN